MNNFIGFIFLNFILIHNTGLAVRDYIAFFIANVIDSFQYFVKVSFVLFEFRKVFFFVSFYLHQEIIPVIRNLILKYFVLLTDALYVFIESVRIGPFEVILVYNRSRVMFLCRFP